MIKLKNLLPEGMTGYSTHGESDNAADYYDELEELYDKSERKVAGTRGAADKTAQLSTAFERWLKKIVKDKDGYGYDLDGWQALALISKTPLFRKVTQAAPKVNVKSHFKQAIQKLEKDVKDAEKEKKEYEKDPDDYYGPGEYGDEPDPDWLPALRRMITAARKWA